MSDIRTVDANGVRFAYHEEGSGPLVLLVHGFPDTPATWDATRTALAGAGYRAVTPFSRGYHPSSVPPDGKYDSDSLGRDVLALIEALGEEKAVVVGHDFGASAAYAAAGLGPERIELLVTVAIPHPAGIKPSIGLAWRVRHFYWLSRKNAPKWVPKDDFAYIDKLVRRWSPAWNVPPGETDAVKKALRDPESLNAVLGYYRALSPKLGEGHRKRVSVPTVCFAGETDIVPVSAYETAKRRFTGPYEIVTLPGGHFMHREHPQRFHEELLRVLRDPPR